MTDLQITTVNDFDENGIFPLRTIRANGKTVQTPTVANQVQKLREHESLHSDSRGVNELYRTVGGDDLDEAMRKADGGKINESLRKQYEKTADDELTITFTKYTETSTLGPAHSKYYATLHAAYSDIITVPLMTNLVRNVDPDNGLADPSYRSLKKSIVAFLNQVEDFHPEKPVMGLLPKLGWTYLDDLVEVYESYGIRAYAFDFDRTKATTANQIGMIGPLMQNIANRGIEEHVLCYAINLRRGTKDDVLNALPAADITSLGLGFDVIGGTHISPRRPPEAFEDTEADQREEDEPQFRLFNRSEWLYRDIPVSRLPEAFPEESEFNAEAVAERVRRSPSNAKSRLQHLVNGEQKALAAADLRSVLESGNAFDTVARKQGVTAQAQMALRQVRGSFDEERFQAGLDDF